MADFARVAPMLAALLGAASGLSAQEPPHDALAVLLEVRGHVQHLDRDEPGGVWPGFAPAGIPVLYVLPGEGTLLSGWDGELPGGFAAVGDVPGAGWHSEAGRGAASTGVDLAGRGTAQVVVDALEVAPLVGLTVHEAFHVFEAAVQADGRRFGRGENSFLVTRYPIFSVENEAGFALEGRALATALRADTDAEVRRHARQFIALREARQRKLDPDLAEFEAMAELNEGLAQYAGVRALLLLAGASDAPRSSEFQAEAERMQGDLERLTANGERSFRLRFYHTGTAEGLLMDRLAGDAWKRSLVEADSTLQDVLAELSGYREGETAIRRQAQREFDAETLTESAAAAIAALRDRLKDRVAAVLAQPGVHVVILEGPARSIGLCGIDPQNLLQVDDGVLLHTRWLRLCAGSALEAEFNTPVVHDRNAGTMRAVIGSPEEVKVTVGGVAVALGGTRRMPGARDVEISAPGLVLRSSRADLEIEGDVVRIRPLPD